MRMLSTLSKVAAVTIVAGCAATVAAGFAATQGQEPRRGDFAVSRDAASSRILALVDPTEGRPPARSEAERIADQVLKAGSDLYDAKLAVGLAATYTEDGTIHVISKEEGEYKDEVKQGRADIEQYYRDLFKDAGAIDSENFVEVARLIAPDLMVIHGRFRPDAGQKAIPFVQMRIKQKDAWLMSKLWLFLSSEER